MQIIKKSKKSITISAVILAFIIILCQLAMSRQVAKANAVESFPHHETLGNPTGYEELSFYDYTGWDTYMYSRMSIQELIDLGEINSENIVQINDFNKNLRDNQSIGSLSAYFQGIDPIVSTKIYTYNTHYYDMPIAEYLDSYLYLSSGQAYTIYSEKEYSTTNTIVETLSITIGSKIQAGLKVKLPPVEFSLSAEVNKTVNTQISSSTENFIGYSMGESFTISPQTNSHYMWQKRGVFEIYSVEETRIDLKLEPEHQYNFYDPLFNLAIFQSNFRYVYYETTTRNYFVYRYIPNTMHEGFYRYRQNEYGRFVFSEFEDTSYLTYI